MAEGRFNFFAPSQQPVDFGIMQRAAEASAALYAGAGEAIGRGLERSEAQRREDALRKERQQKIDRYTKEISDEQNYDPRTYRLAETMFPDVVAQAEPGKERLAIKQHLIGAGYSEVQAESLATAASEVKTARVMRPGVSAKMRAIAFDLLGNKIATTDDLEAISGSDIYESDDQLNNAKIAMANALGRPQELTELARISAQTEANLRQIAAEHDNRLNLSRFETAMQKDVAEFRSQLSIAEAGELDKLAAGAELRRADIEDKLSKARERRDLRAQRILLGEKQKVEEALGFINRQHEKKMLEMKIQADQDLFEQEKALQGGTQMNETQRKAVDDLVNSLVSPSEPLKSIPLQAIYDENTLAGASEIFQDLGVGGLVAGDFTDRERRERALVGATVKVTMKPGGELGIDVDVPNIEGSRPEVEAALEEFITSRMRSSGIEAPAVVGVRQIMGGLPFTDAHRDALTGGLLSPEAQKLLGNELARIAAPVAAPINPPAGAAPQAPPPADNVIGSPPPSRGVLPGAR